MFTYFHVFCRGIERKDIFIDDLDYDRFVQSLWIFNDRKRTRFNLAKEEGREQLVELFEFCLMPNHFHLLVGVEDVRNLDLFLQKIMTGYTMYFKKKYEKDGRVFESRCRSKYVQNDTYLRHLITYIHNNPLGIRYENYKSVDLFLGRFILDEGKRRWLAKYKYCSYGYEKVKLPLTARLNLV